MQLSLENQVHTLVKEHEPIPARSRWIRISRNVVLLGLTSLFTDLSTEMVSAILPLYLTLELGFSPLQFGAFDGLYQGVTALVRLIGGIVADRYQQYKETASVGYALSAGCKLGLFVSGITWGPTLTFLFLDRVGKGIRTAPRDALLSLSSSHETRAEAFGVHRALDTFGALLGPLVAFSLLGFLPNSFDVIFIVSFCIAIVGLGLLTLFVENRSPSPHFAGARPAVSWRSIAALVHVPHFRALLIGSAILSVMTISDSFVYLTLQRRSLLNAHFFPLLYFGTALMYLVLAIPAGRLADRIGRGRVFLGGHLLLAGMYGVLLLPALEPIKVACCLLLLGAYYAATDGVLMAMASRTIPQPVLTSGLALLTTATVLARFLASVLFGALWAWRGPEEALVYFMTGLILALILSLIVFAKRPELART